MEIKDVKFEVNRPQINFDTLGLEESEKKAVQKKKALIIGSTVLTVSAAIVSKCLKARKKLKKKK